MIQKLSHELISQIAAGEVIERPASALKELIENSIDAETKSLLIEWNQGGLNRLRVKDSGTGIAKEDILMSVERHATSKLFELDDLNKLDSLGFRGEALASIASIALLHIKTRHASEDLGSELLVDGSKILSQKTIAHPQGTDIIIQDLFKHTPARRKTMKSEKAESDACLELVQLYALLHPRIAFEVYRDGQKIMDLEAQTDPLLRIEALFGKETRQALIPVKSLHSHLWVQGFMGKPELSRSSSKNSFLFVNHRPVDDKSIHYAIKSAYSSLLMHEKNPWYFLNIEIQPDLVDVNVHPRKKEVKFVNPQEMFRVIHGMTKHALENHALHLGASLPSEGVHFEELSFDFEAPRQGEKTPAPRLEIDSEKLHYLGQVHNSYLLVQSPKGLQLLDQHAVHERVLYEKYKKRLAEKNWNMQSLLDPVLIELSPLEKSTLLEHENSWRELGFDLEWFGEKTIIIRECPEDLLKQNLESLVKDWIQALQEEADDPLTHVREAWITLRACKDAIKFGQKLDDSSAQALLQEMDSTRHSSHCPHGRPAWIEWSLYDLETLFKRKNF